MSKGALWWWFLLNIQSKVQDSDFRDDDEVNYGTDEINKENMNEFGNLVADHKRENAKHGKQNSTSKSGTTFVVRKTSWEKEKTYLYVNYVQLCSISKA